MNLLEVPPSAAPTGNDAEAASSRQDMTQFDLAWQRRQEDTCTDPHARIAKFNAGL